MEKNNTYFCDIDGTIFKYRKFETYKTSAPEVIPTTLEFLEVVKEQGHMIILTTARPEDLREHTIKELDDSKVPYDRLLMGIERGPRYLINDMDPNKPGKRAIAMNLIRNEGI
jgi:ribonucleotide monophosphatase NagD (HAD superfamily)|tara:strand:+ start:5834 stop:6172 length:339 start_codon:yes stop_codon:yes gene_type:complete